MVQTLRPHPGRFPRSVPELIAKKCQLFKKDS